MSMLLLTRTQDKKKKKEKEKKEKKKKRERGIKLTPLATTAIVVAMASNLPI